MLPRAPTFFAMHCARCAKHHALSASSSVRCNDRLCWAVRHSSARRAQVYAQRQGGAANAYRFIFDGNRLAVDQTPDDVRPQPKLHAGAASVCSWKPGQRRCFAERAAVRARPSKLRRDRCRLLLCVAAQLDMEDEDVIDAMLEQVGGRAL